MFQDAKNQLSTKRERFFEDVKNTDWSLITAVPERATLFHEKIVQKINEYFPYKIMTIKSTDDPWISKEIRRNIKIRKAIFKAEGRSNGWGKKENHGPFDR